MKYLEKNGEGLNLTYEVLDGILKHQTKSMPETLEGQIVRLSRSLVSTSCTSSDMEISGFPALLLITSCTIVFSLLLIVVPSTSVNYTPFGHAGERALDELCENGFRHNEQSVRVVKYLEKNGEGLNRTIVFSLLLIVVPSTSVNSFGTSSFFKTPARKDPGISSSERRSL